MQRDIAAGAYRAGDAYLSVREATKRFKVSLVTAHRAIRELARLGVLQVRPASGAYIGRSAPAAPRARTVHVLMPDEPAMRERFARDGLQLGLMQELPRATSMHLHFLKRDEAMADVRAILSAGPALGTDLLGAVLVRVGRTVRQAFASRNVPAVVIGHSDSDVPLPSVGLNQRELGLRTIDVLRRHGRHRPVLLMRDEWDFGDNLLIEGIHQELSEASAKGINIAPLQIRSTPEEGKLVRQVIERLIDDEGPAAFDSILCRSNAIAIEAAHVLQSRQRSDQVMIVSLGATPGWTSTGRLPEIVSVQSDDLQIGRIAAQLLVDPLDPDGHPKRVDLPIEWRQSSKD